ncbi:TetR/AcrR family transcriptional regulator [Umezawaea beigongshangensis]|uniref:TetR/AcrR family transcriptional regulator n=1 Tax=Umezawaea beigongshangensis TaxID=2780383 RepID=UPI001E3924D5|nr:TetR/AcrR family transcriptional regulator [Umezawaea beigongshangensis]
MTADPSRMTPDPAGADAVRLRSDALHNRERILDAAREVLTTRGLDVPMTAIARRAGVGVATLYRRFPTREALITEMFVDQLDDCASALDDALDDPDPWRGFCTGIEKLRSLQVADSGFTAAFLTAFPEAIDFEEKRATAERGLTELVRRAQASGHLRADFDPSDLVLLVLANNGLLASTGTAAAVASRRLVAYLLQSFRADHTGPPAPLPPPAPLDLHDVHERRTEIRRPPS